MPKKRGNDRRKPHVKKCAEKYCRKDADRSALYCSKHQRQRWAKNNPIEYAYANLRGNAKRRGKEFTLTLEEFKKFCEENNYIELKGRYSWQMAIDRIDPNKGYSIDNICMITCAQNSRKMNVEYFRTNSGTGTMPIDYTKYSHSRVNYDPAKDKQAPKRFSSDPNDPNFVPF